MIQGLTIRAPREAELPLVRMLLPLESARPAGRFFRLAYSESGAPVGAISWLDTGSDLDSIRMHVVSAQRRRGIGSAMLAHAVEIASAAGRPRLIAEADLKNEPDAEPFLSARGFALTGRLTSVTSDIERLTPKAPKWYEKVATAGGFPDGSRVVGIAEAPRERILAMFLEYISHMPLLAGMMRNSKIEQFPDSVVLMTGDRVIGFVLAQVMDGTLYIPAWVVDREYQNKRIGTLLLGALDPIVKGRVQRIRYEFTDAAFRTAKIASEYEYEVVGIAARFERAL